MADLAPYARTFSFANYQANKPAQPIPGLQIDRELDDISARLKLFGKSAYELAVLNGFTGSIGDWLLSLVGPRGPQGVPGAIGAPGTVSYQTMDLFTAAEVPAVVQAVTVAGFSAPYDGAQHMAFAAVADDGSALKAWERRVSGRRWRLTNATVTPQMFGGGLVAGAYDDTAFRAVADYIASRGTRGGEIIFTVPHKISQGWRVKSSNTTLRCLGSGQIQCDMADIQQTDPNNLQGLGAVWGYNLDNVNIEDLNVVCKTGVKRSLSAINIYFFNSSRIRVSRSQTLNGLSGVWLNNCSDSRVDKCYIDSPVADGIHFSHGSKRCWATDNFVIRSIDDGIAATSDADSTGNYALRTADIVFKGNIVASNRWGKGYALYGVDRAVVIGNQGYDLAGPLVGVEQYVDPNPNTFLTITSNKGVNVGQALTVPNSVWEFTDPASDPAASPSFNCGLSLDHVNQSLVAHNEIYGVYGVVGQRSAVYLSSCASLRLLSNAFSLVAGRGVWAIGTLSDIDADDNVFADVTGVCLDFVSNVTSLAGSTRLTRNYGRRVGSGSAAFLSVAKAGSSPVYLNGNNTDLDGQAQVVDTVTVLAATADVWLNYTANVRAASGAAYTIDATRNIARFRVVNGMCEVEIRFKTTATNGGQNANFDLPRAAASSDTFLKLNGRGLINTDVPLKGFMQTPTVGLIQAYTGANFTTDGGEYIAWAEYRVR